MKKFNLGKIGSIAILSFFLIACQKDINSKNESSTEELTPKAFKQGDNVQQGIIFYALTGLRLDKYSTTNPDKLISSATITGLQPGETILGIDFRPATGQLYGLGSNSRLYVINPMTGVATFVAALTTVPTGSTTAVPLALEGTSFGFDFNPTVDRIRIVSNTDQNLRANPTTGVTIVDGRINPEPASINGVAYDNNDTDPATGTELYALDITTDLLYELDPPNGGTLINPLPIKLNIEGDGGFDIAPRNANVTTDIGLAIYQVSNHSTLFMIDVETGATTILAKYKHNNGNHFGNDKNKSVTYTALAISAALQ